MAEAGTSSPRVSVVVVTKDQAGLLAGCLVAVDAQDFPYAEVLVVDNGSTDGTARLVSQHARTARLPVRLLREPGTLGAARQRGVEAARGELLAFTDSDCRPQAGWLAAAVAAFEADPRLDVVQGRTLPAAPTFPWCATQQIERFTDLYETCNIVYRTDRLRRAGGFDPAWGFFGEDTLAGWRVRRLGGTGRYLPTAVVRHEVLPGGHRWHLRRATRYDAFNALVRRFPEMRNQLLWHRCFLRRRSAEFDALIAGLALAAIGARRRRPADVAMGLALTAPALHRHRGQPWGLAFDAAACLALVRGSVRERTIVL